jgi:hypothetical protein
MVNAYGGWNRTKYAYLAGVYGFRGRLGIALWESYRMAKAGVVIPGV